MLRLLAIALALFSFCGAGLAQDKPLTFCAEPGEASLWFRHATGPDGKPLPAMAGFSVDMLTAAFAKMGKTAVFRGDLPWSRCLRLVEAGDIHYAFGAYHNEQRAKVFAYSKPYKTLTPQIFYSSKRPITVKTTQDLKRYRGCGLHSASYLHYGLGDGDLERGVTNIASLVAKLKAGRCDYFPEELETFAASAYSKTNYLADPELRHVPIEGASAPARHLVAAKNSEAARLLPGFDAQVAAMLKSGEFMQLWRKNAGDLPF